MKISIVMATYNGEKFILKQLQSVLEQSLPADEVIIGDDCSNDSTVEVIENFIKENKQINWIVRKNKSNLGWRKNFFDMLNYVTGDIIFFCDQDDIWVNDKLQVMSRIMANNRGILALSGRVCVIGDNDEEIGISRSNSISSADTNKILQKKINEKIAYSVAYGCTLAVSKSLLEYIKYVDDEKRRYFPHDTFFWRMAMFLDGAYVLDREVIKYRRHSNNETEFRITNKVGLGNLHARLVPIRDEIELDEGLRDIFKVLNVDDKEYKMKVINKSLRVMKMRSKLLKQKKLRYIPILIYNYNYYPTILALLGDIAYAMGINAYAGKFINLIRK